MNHINTKTEDVMEAKVSAYLVKMVLRATVQGYKGCYVHFNKSGWTSFRGAR
jgi:hypothetical protein